jgi:hypothetical protein
MCAIKGSAAVLTAAFLPAGNKPSLTFKRGETVYRQSSIWESGTDGRTIAAK